MQDPTPAPGQTDNDSASLPERARRYWSGPLQLEQLELGQQLTTRQAEGIIDELIESDRRFRSTPVKPEPYRPGFRRGD